jgi:hypothetical protein
MQINWLWLVVGLIPYSIKRQHTKDEQVLGMHALCWRFTIRWYRDTCSWDLSLRLICHLKQ